MIRTSLKKNVLYNFIPYTNTSHIQRSSLDSKGNTFNRESDAKCHDIDVKILSYKTLVAVS